MDIKNILDLFLKKFGVKCYLFCEEVLNEVPKYAIINKQKNSLKTSDLGPLDSTEYTFLFAGKENLGNEFKKSGYIFANNEKYIVLNVTKHTLKGATLYYKIVCRKEECL